MTGEKKKKDNEELLILLPRSRMGGKNTMVINRIMSWLDKHEKEVKKITFEFF